MSKPPFYIVWCPSCPTPPRARHDTRDSAEREAARLARLNRGSEFFVMRAITSTRAADLEVVEFAPHDISEIPL